MRLICLVLALELAVSPAAAQPPAGPFRLVLKDHRFTPDTLTVPAGQKFKLEVVNGDASGDELESAALKVEREIAPHGKLLLQLGPLAAGAYPFVGDLHAETAKGVIVAAEPTADAH
jgi:hypothetical protein